MTATSGRKCLERFTRLNPDGSWQKMFLDSLLCTTEWYSMECALTWKLKATKFSRLLFQLVPKVRRTEGIGFGLLGTPVSPDDNKSPEAHMRMKANMKGGPRYKATSLQVQIAMLPTPRGEDSQACGNHPGATDSLTGVMKILPTPKGTKSGPDYARVNRGGSGGDDLETGMAKTGMKLQPAFVEWMQGFPIGWTDLNA
jgi:hypothetical protein